jgi:hypothetical protein
MGWLLRLLRLRGEGYGAVRQRIQFVDHGHTGRPRRSLMAVGILEVTLMQDQERLATAGLCLIDR